MRHGILAALLLLATGLAVAAEPSQRTLTFEDRVSAQKAIEQVYWSHRIWPKENPGPKPTLSAVMPDDAIRAEVEDYLKKSNALEKWWQRPITAEQLQAEMNRMAMHSRDPQLLSELFRALRDDPSLVAETLVRQTLAERLIRNWYAYDMRFHSDLKREALAALAYCVGVDCMTSLGCEKYETTWKLQTNKGKRSNGASGDRTLYLDADQWKADLSELARRLGGNPESLPLGKFGDLDETPDAFLATAALAQDNDQVATVTIVWPKTAFDSWWAKQRETVIADVPSSTLAFKPAVLGATACVNDTWMPTRSDVPDGRSADTAVWTGTEMIVWGGYVGGSDANTGGRYNPSTDSWIATSTGANVPAARSGHTAIWTGMEMIVWGGLRPEYRRALQPIDRLVDANVDGRQRATGAQTAHRGLDGNGDDHLGWR